MSGWKTCPHHEVTRDEHVAQWVTLRGEAPPPELVARWVNKNLNAVCNRTDDPLLFCTPGRVAGCSMRRARRPRRRRR